MAIRLSDAQKKVMRKVLLATLSGTEQPILMARESRSLRIAYEKVCADSRIGRHMPSRSLRTTDSADWKPGDPIYPYGT